MIEAVGPGNQPTHAFQVNVDLVQVIPYIAESAALDGNACVPAFTLSSNSEQNAVAVDDIFQPAPSLQGAIRVAWDRPIEVEEGAGVTNRPYYVRVYRCYPGATKPLADLTCATQQTLEAGESSVVVRYSSEPGTPAKAFPRGLYKVSTFTQASTVQTPCSLQVYPSIRTKIAVNMPVEGDPPVKSQEYWFKVGTLGSIEPSPVPPPGCPLAPPECHRGLGTCVADVDDGNDTGEPDGGVTVDDLLYYLRIFEAGAICADVDGGLGDGCLDQGVTIDDLLYYLLRFEIGC